MVSRSLLPAIMGVFVAAPAFAGVTVTDSTDASAPAVRAVVAGEHYHAGGFHRFLLGADYRHLWTTPIEVPVLDLHTVAGGLRPVMRVGGQQTLGLALKGADGRSYTFRGLDKDPSEILPPEFHDTFVDRLLQDQIASSFPGGAVVVPPLLDAAGVLHVEPVLVVLPDDSLLGEFRPVFAGLLGTFEEYPRAASEGDSGFAGATEIIDGAELWKRMDESESARADSRAFLAARLVDILIGDWDRHRGQWRWAKVPGKERWQPIPEDRDQAFVKFEGFVPTVGRQRLPQFVSFGDEYPGIEGLTWNGRDGDRRILVDLEKSDWDAVAADLQARIGDDVIDDAVARLPDAYRRLEGDALAEALRRRRDALTAVADRFYRFLARDVDIHATRQSEFATVTHSPDGNLDVSVSLARTGAASAPYFHRVFHADETDEVRIYLGGGADTLVATGRPAGITVRVIGGGEAVCVDDSDGGGLRVSGASSLTVRRGDGTRVDTRPYTPPERKTAPWIPPRDWGRRTLFIPWILGNTDLGVLFMASVQSEGYGFRKDPNADAQTLRVGYATRAGAFGADYRGQFRHENSRVFSELYVRASGLDILHYYGFGNETDAPVDDDFFKVKHTEYLLEPSLHVPIGAQWTAALRVSAKYSKTNLDEDRYIAGNPPYGSNDLFQLGTGAGVSIDTRESGAPLDRGVRLSADGAVFPPIGGIESTFGGVRVEAAYYRSVPLLPAPTLALHAGGKQMWGRYPWYEAAYIGGGRTVRGFAEQRFGGDASLYGSAELRIPITRVYIFVPGTLGVFGFGDVGRVFLDGESSDRWHAAGGGGIWLAFLSPENAVSLSVAGSDEDTRIYVYAGLSF